MKWTRRTEFGECNDYVSQDGRYRVRDMSFHDKTGWWQEHGRRGYWWGLIEVTPNGERIVQANIKTAKAAKALAETL